MRLLVCGNRDWTDSGEISYHLAVIFGRERDRLVIHGNSGDLLAKPPRGADKIAGWCAAGVGAAVEVYAVDQRLDGPWPGAGPARNARMLRDSRPDQGLAFGKLWKPVLAPNQHKTLIDVGVPLKLTGTGDMVQRLIDAQVPVRWVPSPTPRAFDSLPSMSSVSRYFDLVEMPGPRGVEV